jgi:drug/metabolite transporter (DMT)-like permease
MIYSIADYGLITISYTFTKMLFASNDCFSSFEVYAARMIVQLLCSQIHMYFVNKNKANLSKEDQAKISLRSLTRWQIFLIILRVILSFPSWLLVYYSLRTIPVGVVQTILNFTPFFVIIISYVALKESIHKIEIVNMIISFSASVLIISTSHKESVKKQDDINGDQTEYFLGIISSIVATLFQASVYVIVRALKDVHSSIVGTA